MLGQEGRRALLPGAGELGDCLHHALGLGDQRLRDSSGRLTEGALQDGASLVADGAGLVQPVGVLLLRGLECLVQGQVACRRLSRFPAELFDDTDGLDQLLELTRECVASVTSGSGSMVSSSASAGIGSASSSGAVPITSATNSSDAEDSIGIAEDAGRQAGFCSAPSSVAGVTTAPAVSSSISSMALADALWVDWQDMRLPSPHSENIGGPR
jgi:hypothetical protein